MSFQNLAIQKEIHYLCRMAFSCWKYGKGYGCTVLAFVVATALRAILLRSKIVPLHFSGMHLFYSDCSTTTKLSGVLFNKIKKGLTVGPTKWYIFVQSIHLRTAVQLRCGSDGVLHQKMRMHLASQLKIEEFVTNINTRKVWKHLFAYPQGHCVLWGKVHCR
jgi:hypothetical protein